MAGNIWQFLGLLFVPIFDVVDPGSKTIDTLMRLNLPAGVDIEIKL